MKTKICSRCKIDKSISDFHKSKDKRLGIRSACKVCTKLYRDRTKTKMKIYQTVYRRDNKATSKKYQKIYCNKNKNQKVVYDRLYRIENREKIRAYHNIWYKKRYRLDPVFRLNNRIKSGIRLSLRGNKDGKRWRDIVGYTIKQLKKHLEKQFTKGMTWENYGKWQIDHIIPISAFNFTKPEHGDFKRCWALSNLQPLWAIDNQKKSNRLEKPFQPMLAL